MNVAANNLKPMADPTVAVLLTGGQVTASFRASLFAAAGRNGMSVNEFVLTAAAEKLQSSGAPFTGLFRTGDLVSQGEANPFEGSQDRVPLEIGAGFVTEAERAAFERHKPVPSYFQWAVDLMRAAVRADVRAKP